MKKQKKKIEEEGKKIKENFTIEKQKKKGFAHALFLLLVLCICAR